MWQDDRHVSVSPPSSFPLADDASFYSAGPGPRGLRNLTTDMDMHQKWSPARHCSSPHCRFIATQLILLYLFSFTILFVLHQAHIHGNSLPL